VRPPQVPRLEDHSPLTLAELLREDWETHGRSFAMPGLHALVLHRLAVWGSRQPPPARILVRAVVGVLNLLLIRNVYGVEISRTTVIGRRVRIGHHQGLVLGTYAVLGDDCLLRQNVTLGQSNDAGSPDDQPRVGNRVEFGAGATVIGPVRIGDGARIGPGAVVTTHVPAGATAFAAPARILKARPADDQRQVENDDLSSGSGRG
jgi:serine O-acetyltransferase